MAKQPYIKFWTGDWLRDTQLLSNAAKGFWIDLICHLHDSVITGVITLDITELCRLSRENMQTTELLLDELSRRNICDIKKHTSGTYEIRSRRMLRDADKASKKSVAGKKGMQNRYNKNINSVITNDITETITECGNGIGNNYKDNKDKGGMGEKGKEDVRNRDYTHNSVMKLDECLQAYVYSDICIHQRNILCMTRTVFIRDGKEYTELIQRWAAAFNMHLVKRGNMEARTLSAWCDHLFNWICKQDLTKEPEKLYEQHKPTNGQPTNTGANYAGTGRQAHAATIIQRPTD